MHWMSEGLASAAYRNTATTGNDVTPTAATAPASETQADFVASAGEPALSTLAGDNGEGFSHLLFELNREPPQENPRDAAGSDADSLLAVTTAPQDAPSENASYSSGCFHHPLHLASSTLASSWSNERQGPAGGVDTPT